MKNISFTSQAYTDYLVSVHNVRYLRYARPKIAHPEFSGLWSRRINQEHRLVYRITGDTIDVISCKYHYSR